MSWQAPERPEWVAAINRGEVAPIAEEAMLPLERDALLGEARARLGLAHGPAAAAADDFGHAAFPADAMIEALDRVLHALEHEARLTTMGRWMTRRFLLRLLEVRLHLMATLRSDPGVRDEEIVQPLFVAGAPRTGTTILHAMLAADPQNRVPLGWELLRPVPSPEFVGGDGAQPPDPRVALADRELVLPQTVVSGLLSIHAYGASKPKECLSAMSFTFLSEEFTARYHVPSYEAWLEACDLEPAYRMHELVLQILQRRVPRERRPTQWVLKSPVHLHTLTTLFRVYPGAQVAVTHRDPLTILASLTSLIATLRWAHSDSLDYAAIAESHAARYRKSFAQLTAWTEAEALPRNQVHHSRYADFLGDPLAVVAGLYERFGRIFGAEARARVEASLAARPKGEHGEHSYAFDELGLDRASERAHFAPYQRVFGVPDEG